MLPITALINAGAPILPSDQVLPRLRHSTAHALLLPQVITQAYEVLCDPSCRKKYDTRGLRALSVGLYGALHQYFGTGVGVWGLWAPHDAVNHGRERGLTIRRPRNHTHL